MRLAGRRLLQSSSVPRASLIVPRVAFPHARAISTTTTLFNPREARARPSWASRTEAPPTDPVTPAAPAAPAAPTAAPTEPIASGKPSAQAEATTPEPSFFSRLSSTAASRSAASDHVYDATSHGTFDLSKIISDESDEFLNKHYDRSVYNLRCKPVLGRTVTLAKGMDLAAGLRQLNNVCRQNKMKDLYRMQKFHERPGLKRKRLVRERSEKRFKKSFKATVKRVQELSNQGW